MKHQTKISLILGAYFLSIVLGNLIVFWLGHWGVLITSFVFIPFDFVIRCYIHEKFRRGALYAILFSIISIGALMTFLLNSGAGPIALGSVIGFTAAGIVGSLIYQMTIRKKAIWKVNGSDIGAIIVDSFLFQWIAFSSVSFAITGTQIVIKIIGGLLWYYVIFVHFKMIDKIKNEPITVLKKIDSWERMSKSHGIVNHYLKLMFHDEEFWLVLAFSSGTGRFHASLYKRKGEEFFMGIVEELQIVNYPLHEEVTAKEAAFKAARIYFRDRNKTN